MKINRYTALLSLFLLFLLTGCNKALSLDPVVTAPAKKVFANNELNVAVFEDAFGKDYWLAVKQRFEADYPGVKVKLTQSPKIMYLIKPQIVAGTPPDIIYTKRDEDTGTIAGMIADNQMLDLTDTFESNALDKKEPLKNKLINGILENVKPQGNGKIYEAPFYMSSLGLIYNKNLFEKKGWNVPKTWDEFMALGELAKNDGRSLFTYQGIDPSYNDMVFWPTVASAGGLDVVAKAANYEKDAIKADPLRKVMELYSTIAQKGYLMPGSVALNHTQAQTAFMQGKALFITCGLWIENEMKDSPRESGFQFGFLAPPVFKEGDQRYAMMWFDGLYIPAKAKNIELAKEFLRYQYNDEIVRLNAEKSQGIVAVTNGSEIAKPYISPAFYDATKIFSNGVKPLMFEWKTTPKTKTKTIIDNFWNPLGAVMNRSMTVTEWQDQVELSNAKLRDLIEIPAK